MNREDKKQAALGYVFLLPSLVMFAVFMFYPLFYDQFQFIGGMKVGEPSADGRGSAPPELAEQQARAGSEAAPATPPL